VGLASLSMESFDQVRTATSSVADGNCCAKGGTLRRDIDLYAKRD